MVHPVSAGWKGSPSDCAQQFPSSGQMLLSGNVGCWNGGPSVGRTRERVTLPCEDVERKNQCTISWKSGTVTS